MFAAAAITTLGTLPVFLLSAQAVLVQDDLGYSNLQIGVAATLYFAAAALGSIPVGRFTERTSARTSAVRAAFLASVSLLGIGLFAVSYPFLLVFLAIGGVANAAGQVAANVLLANRVPARRQGLAFGAKQSAVPASMLLGGLAVPTLGLTIGWRWTYACSAALALIVGLQNS